MNAIFRNVKSFDGQPANKTRVATFYGTSHMAERDDSGDLHIYKVSTENEPMNTVGDTAGAKDTRSFGAGPHISVGKLQQINERFREQNVGFFDKGCGGHRR